MKTTTTSNASLGSFKKSLEGLLWMSENISSNKILKYEKTDMFVPFYVLGFFFCSVINRKNKNWTKDCYVIYK